MIVRRVNSKESDLVDLLHDIMKLKLAIVSSKSSKLIKPKNYSISGDYINITYDNKNISINGVQAQLLIEDGEITLGNNYNLITL